MPRCAAGKGVTEPWTNTGRENEGSEKRKTEREEGGKRGRRE